MGLLTWLRHHIQLSRFNITARKKALEAEFVQAGISKGLLQEIFDEERKYSRSKEETWLNLHLWYYRDPIPVYTTHPAFIDIARRYRRSRLLLAMVRQLRDEQKGENMGKITMDKFKQALNEAGYEVEEVHIEGQKLLIVDTSRLGVCLKKLWMKSKSFFKDIFRRDFDKE